MHAQFAGLGPLLCYVLLAKYSNGASYGTNVPHRTRVYTTTTPFMTFGPLITTTHTMPLSPVAFPILQSAFPSPVWPNLICLLSGASHTTNHHGPDSVVGNGEGQTNLYGRCVLRMYCMSMCMCVKWERMVYIYVRTSSWRGCAD